MDIASLISQVFENFVQIKKLISTLLCLGTLKMFVNHSLFANSGQIRRLHLIIINVGDPSHVYDRANTTLSGTRGGAKRKEPFHATRSECNTCF